MRRVFIDTGAFYALADKSDACHDAALAVGKDLLRRHMRVFTSDLVVAETHVFMLHRLGHPAARRWLSDLDVPIEFATEVDFSAARQVIMRHGDQAYSLADAVSMAIMRRTGVEEVFGFDRHFVTAGFTLLGPAGGARAHLF